MLQWFLSNCPLLSHVCLNGQPKGTDFAAEGNKFTFVDLFQCVPLIKTLNISKYYMKCLSVGGMPHKLPTSLVNLEYLFLDVCLMEHNEIAYVFCMIRSSPTLVEINFQMYDNKKSPVQQTPANFLDPKDYSDMKLERLETLKIGLEKR
ncbi:hypothetical protein QVD17_20923 [Tagetes erecta]|uniref:Uncharacterized protein n=1 Tax=Tagetes erecta TaxID=13708 RepID=A0AAD8NYI6_TARER|nr:hypothetical protein QVD17_20923 [Tagetes erecta]